MFVFTVNKPRPLAPDMNCECEDCGCCVNNKHWEHYQCKCEDEFE